MTASNKFLLSVTRGDERECSGKPFLIERAPVWRFVPDQNRRILQ
jgi:hypothetical protein